MKYHKIPNVDKSVCTAEQMIAYNIAFRVVSNIDMIIYNNLETAIQKGEYVQKLRKEGIKAWQDGWRFDDKYDIDAIDVALHDGLPEFLRRGELVLGSYEVIGKIFPAPYLTKG